MIGKRAALLIVDDVGGRISSSLIAELNKLGATVTLDIETAIPEPMKIDIPKIEFPVYRETKQKAQWKQEVNRYRRNK